MIQFSGDLKIGPANAIPRNVVAIKGGERQATLDLAPGTVMHDWRYGDLLVIDVRDPGTQLPASSGQATIAKSPTLPKLVQANGQSTQPKSARPQPAQPDTGKPAASKPETATPTTPKLAPAASTSDGSRPPPLHLQVPSRPITKSSPLHQTWGELPVRPRRANTACSAASPTRRRPHDLKRLSPLRRPEPEAASSDGVLDIGNPQRRHWPYSG